MASTLKSLSSSVLKSFDNSLSRLTARYLATISNIDTSHNNRLKEISGEAQKKKNSADASAKIALANTKAGLLQKGLSRSGDSVQAELDNNLARMSAISSIEEEAEKSKRQTEESRSEAKNSAFIGYLNDVNGLEKARNEAYRNQLNLDRDYEADRDDEIYDRFADNRDYEAKRDDEIYDRFADNRDYEAKRDDEIYDRFADNRDYEAERDDEIYDRFADNRDYEADRDDEIYDRYRESQKDEDGDSSEGASGEEKIVPKYSPKVLVDKIFSNNRTKYYSDSKKQYSETKKAIEAIIEDESLDYSYRYQVKIYAKALGFI